MLVAILACLALNQEPEFKPLPVPAQAVIAAVKDASTLPAFRFGAAVVVPDAPYQRYLWFRETDKAKLKEDMQAAVYALNMTAQIGVNSAYRPIQAGERLLRVDLRCLSESLEGLKDVIALWEEYQYDPAFSTLITKDTLALIAESDAPKVRRKLRHAVKSNWRIVDQNKQFTQDGRKVWGRWEWDTEWREEVVEVSIKSLADVDVIRLPGEHLDLEPYAALQSLLQTEAPIIEADYFLTRSLASIEGTGVFKTIFGGLYYRHVGLKRSSKAGVTDEDLLLERFGVVNTAKGETTKDVFKRLRSDRRLAKFFSNVTGQTRLVEWFPHLGAPPEEMPVVMVTGDVSVRNLDTVRRPVFDLEAPKVEAREWLIVRANGTILGVLTKATDGTLQEKAPDDVARDHTVPPPHSTELQAVISCLACHGPHEGWIPARNDVQLMFRSRAAIFGQAQGRKVEINFDKITRIEEQYRGAPDDLFRMLRTAHASAVLRITGPWARSKDQVDVAKLAAAHVVKRWRGYNYDLIDAQAACRELGFDVAKDAAVGFLRKLLPPINTGLHVGDLVPEDVRVWGLLSGVEITRSDWSLLYSYVAVRSQKTLSAK